MHFSVYLKEQIINSQDADLKKCFVASLALRDIDDKLSSWDKLVVVRRGLRKEPFGSVHSMSLASDIWHEIQDQLMLDLNKSNQNVESFLWENRVILGLIFKFSNVLLEEILRLRMEPFKIVMNDYKSYVNNIKLLEGEWYEIVESFSSRPGKDDIARASIQYKGEYNQVFAADPYLSLIFNQLNFSFQFHHESGYCPARSMAASDEDMAFWQKLVNGMNLVYSTGLKVYDKSEHLEFLNIFYRNIYNTKYSTYKKEIINFTKSSLMESIFGNK